MVRCEIYSSNGHCAGQSSRQSRAHVSLGLASILAVRVALRWFCWKKHSLEKIKSLVWQREQDQVRRTIQFVKAVHDDGDLQYTSLINILKGDICFKPSEDTDVTRDASGIVGFGYSSLLLKIHRQLPKQEKKIKKNDCHFHFRKSRLLMDKNKVNGFGKSNLCWFVILPRCRGQSSFGLLCSAVTPSIQTP